MPVLFKPTNDESRLSLLVTSSNTAQADQTAGNSYLSQETLASINTLKAEFESLIKTESGLLAGRSKEIREKNEAMARLNTFIRDIWEVLKRRVSRNSEPAEVLTYYGLPLDGTVRPSLSENEILTLAATIIDGDTKALGAGYAAISCPSALELNAVLESAKKEAGDIAMADRQYSNAQKDLAKARQSVDTLIDDIIAELDFALRKLEASNRRRIMRTYGVSYKYSLGETTDVTTETVEATE